MKRILIIEDNSDISNLTKDLLELEGFEVAIADNGRDGVALARQQQPDLVLCDITLPELDGYSVLRALRQHPASAMIPFIFLTSKASKADLRQGMRLGADDYLTKPFTPADLLDAIAIRLAKQADTRKFYTQSSPLVPLEQQALVESLSRAIERSELLLYYQPQVDLKTQAIVGVECLLRWHHTERGLVSPAEFIPLAEQTGLIIPIGEWVLQTACHQAKVWQAAGLGHLRIAVNLSASQFSQSTLPDTVIQILQETGLDPEWLDLELTESMLMQDSETSSAMLNKLKSLGIHISIDDFGTGYSSLSYLQRFSFDTLKIDRSFVQNASSNPKSAAIAIAVIQMAHRLQLQVIAEGVENQAELAFLNQHGCDMAQGYWFSKPLPTPDLTQLLSN
jgi:EAL domain-containing protein (putative c-di-GMP-specific phosphodiesterase class I)/FixJ family two-component response regulator